LEITVVGPQNHTQYSSSDLNLTLRITKTLTSYPMEVGQFYVVYDLDSVPLSSGLGVQDLVNNDCVPEIYYNTVLNDLRDGKHELLVSLECFPENVTAYWVKSKI
jgi:hypothetical protein